MTFPPKPLGSAVALLTLLCAAPAATQTPQATITGVVRDVTGIGIPAATVTATNRATNASQTATTGNDRSYSLSLAPGAYEVAASFPGANYQWQVMSTALAYVTGTYQHIGSRSTQVGDEELGTLDLLSFEPDTIGRPLTARVFTYDPELSAYDIVNLRAGVRRDAWDVAFYVNNVTDERALLSFDRERNTRARIGYLTSQPRTVGISTRFGF